MKKLFILLLTLSSFMAFASVAEAKRFGFGKSFGYSKQVAPKNYGQKNTFKTSPASKPSAQPGKAGAAKSRSAGLGILGGLAAGGLLAALFMGGGFDGIQLFDILIIGVVGFILFKLFIYFRRQPKYAGHQDEYAVHQDEQPPANTQQRDNVQAAYPAPSASGSIFGTALSEEAQPISELPAWFDEQGFVDNAKSHFVAVQAAWDAADVTELKDYCSPELLAAMSVEMAALQPGANHTVVDELNVELVDAVLDGEYLVVSVRFTGFIIEELGGEAHAFNEIWHIRRLAEGSGNWQISGIQQP